MTTLEERVSRLEAHVQNHSQDFLALRDSIGRLEQRLDARLESFENRFVHLEQRFDRLDDKVSSQFVWLAGMLGTVLVAVIGGLLSW